MPFYNQHSTVIAGSSSQEGFLVEDSLRIRKSASAYLSRTPTVTGNRKVWTFSAWVKRGSRILESGSTSSEYLFTCTSQSGNDGIAALMFVDNQLVTYYDTSSTNPYGAVGPAYYRDPSAWYHIVWAVDAANTIHKIWVNGVLVSTDTSKYPVDYEYAMNRAGYLQTIGAQAWSPSLYGDYYIAEVNYVDGQYLTADDFGETDLITGVWKPKQYLGTYGTNGFRLDFTSATTTPTTVTPTDSEWGAYFGGSTSTDTLTIPKYPTVLSGFSASSHPPGLWTMDFNFSLPYESNVSATRAYITVSFDDGTTRTYAGGGGNGSPTGVYSSGRFTYDPVTKVFSDGGTIGGSVTTVYTGKVVTSISMYGGYSGSTGYLQRTTFSEAVFGIGQDSSGNGNTWTANNISMTEGTTYDLMNDVPTLTDEDNANFPTWNPVRFANSQASYSEGNLKSTHSNNVGTSATIAFPSSGKWYFEASPTGITYFNNTNLTAVGIIPDPVPSFSDANQYGYTYAYNGQKVQAGSNSSYGATYTTGDLIGVAFDVDAGTLTFYKNGVSQGTAFTGISSSTTYFASGCQRNAHGWYINFGQRPFAYTPPTGFKKLNTYNLPDSTIEDGSEQFNTVLYTGNGSTQSITGVGFQPDWVWIKSRSQVTNHGVHDVLRVIGSAEAILYPNATNAESTGGAWISSFNSDGFTVNANTAGNNSGSSYVAWNWKANGSGVSNTDGSTTSTVSANTTSGFSIVTYTGTGANATVGHGLGVTPAMFIIKSRSNAYNWVVYHKDKSLNGSSILNLNSTSAGDSGAGYLNDTGPSSSVFTVGSGVYTNRNSFTYVAYCFADVEGFSNFGGYTGNGSADGPFIYTGFRPALCNGYKSTNISLDTSGGFNV